MAEEKQQLENDEFEVLYKKLRTASRRLYVVEEEIDELYARVERLEKEQKREKDEKRAEIEELKKVVDGIIEEIKTLRTDIVTLEEKVDDLDRRLVDCEEDIKKLSDKLDDLKSYTDKTFAIAKKVERHLGLEEDEKSRRRRR
ncbi:hypothetical protein [Thermococcus sp.]|uniref:hypothetical protein n=1 Tax=Thermococcus sp. TaxID=35749 RepID=UPI0025EF76BD|nr:hypothetical protein [Thermococcus sp.]